jgi:REP element-mobilizing transposase RayT
MRHSKGQQRLRIGRFSEHGQVYIVTAVTVNRVRIFEQAAAADIVLDCMKWLDLHGRIRLEACVVMPDHVHGVLALASGSLPDAMRSFKGYSGRRLSELRASGGPIWQRGYHDHALRHDESVRQAIGYCLANPVRVGLVQDFHDYPFWMCRYEV